MVFVVLYCMQLFWWFSYKPSEKYWAISPKGKHQLFKLTLSTFQKCLSERCSAFFLGCNWRKMFWDLPEISLLEPIHVFCSNAESRFNCASFRRIGLVLWLFIYCVRDVFWYRILIKTALFSWGKQKISRTTLSTFQNCLFELWWTCCFGCK